MIKNLDAIISDDARSMKPSALGELIGMATKPEIISFGGGFPSPDSFPIEELKEIMLEVLDTQGPQALQYGETLGLRRLREILAERYRAKDLKVTADNIMITTSSQQAIDIIASLFINPGDTLVCGLPTYLGALQAFDAHRAEPVGIYKDEELEVVVKALITAGKKPKFIYAIPDFQNPSGVTMSIENRKSVLAVAKKYDLLILEDSPYQEIRFTGEHMPLMYAMDDDERVMLLGTFSKTFAPGFRLGWIIAPVPIIQKLEVVKQAFDLCSPTFSQHVAVKYFEKGYFDRNLVKIREDYREKKDNMIAAFEKYMPEGVTWTNPEGGLFLFLTLPPQYDTRELFKLSIKENVAFIIGEAFHCDGSGKNTLRMNFSFTSKEVAEEGVRRLAKAIKKLMAKNK